MNGSNFKNLHLIYSPLYNISLLCKLLNENFSNEACLLKNNDQQMILNFFNNCIESPKNITFNSIIGVDSAFNVNSM